MKEEGKVAMEREGKGKERKNWKKECQRKRKCVCLLPKQFIRVSDATT